MYIDQLAVKNYQHFACASTSSNLHTASSNMFHCAGSDLHTPPPLVTVMGPPLIPPQTSTRTAEGRFLFASCFYAVWLSATRHPYDASTHNTDLVIAGVS